MTTMYQQPDFSQALGSISHLNNDELKELLNNDAKFEEMLNDLRQFKDLEQEKEMVLASIKSLSDFNLTKEPELVEDREKLAQRSEEGEEISQRVHQKMDELRSKGGNLTADTALALLQTAAAEMEEESEKVAQDFLGGDMDIEEFLVQFANKRKIMHLRKVKADKMSELIRQPTIPNYINAPPVTINTNFFPTIPNAIPYPSGPVNMPLPGAYFQNY